MSDFSVQENILSPQPFKKSTAAFKLVTLQTGILNNAPADVFIASLVTKAESLLGITMACTPKHSAVLAIAPKFLTSFTLSKINIKGSSPFS